MIKLLLAYKTIILAVVLSFLSLSVFGLSRYSAATGNWNATSTWAATLGGAAGASVPVAGDDVFIVSGFNVTVTANAACSSITFTTATATSLSVNSGITLNVSGAITIPRSGSGLNTIAVGAGNMNAASIAFTSGGGTVRHSVTISTGTVIVSGNITTDNTGLSASITFTGAGILRAGGTLLTTPTNGGTLTTVAGSTVEYNGAGAQTVKVVTYAGNLILSGSGAKTVTGITVNGILSMEGTATATGTSPAFGANATLQYKGSAAQTTGSELPATFTGSGGVIINNAAGVSLASSVSISSTLTLTSGAFSISANTLTLSNSANLSYGGGSLTGGTTSNITIGTGTAITLNSISGGLNNFNISRNITLGGNLSLNGTLILTAGTFTVGANTLTLNGPAIAGTPSNLTTAASSSLVFGGSSAGVSIPSSVANLNNLTVNNSNGVALTAGLSVSNTLTMIQGNIISGANTLILSNNAVGSLSYTTGTITGKLQRAVAATGVEYFYPVGTLTLNNPLKITFTNLTAGQLAVQFQPNDIGLTGLPLLGDSGADIYDRQTNGYWTLIAVGAMASTNYSVKLNYSGFTGVDSRGRIIKRTNGGSLFLDGTHGTVASPEISRTGMNGISTVTTDLAIGKPNVRITSQPVNITGCNSTFSVTASGRPVLGYQWQENNGGGFSNITNGGIYSGATSSTLTLSGATFTMNGYAYRCIVTDGYGYTVTSSSAILTVLEVALGYDYERNITIDYTKVAGGTDLFNFPFMINISGQNFLKNSPAGQIFNPNGFDIIFTDNNFNKLDHQLEYYNGSSGDLIAWVRIPTLSSSSNTVIKILYGNPQVTLDPSVTTVWDSHYKGVWHLDNNSLNDFTSFNKAGTSYNSPTYPAGMISNSLGLNGTDQYAAVINDPNINFAGNITISAWVYMNAGGRDQKIAGNQNNSSGGYKFGIYTNDKVEFEIRNAANTPSLNRAEPGGTVLSTGQWYYLAGISSDVLDSIKTFVNGIPERPFRKTGILGQASDNLTIGREPFLSDYFFNGRFDEIRISNKVRSNGWMRTEYNNQSSPSTFYALDAAGVAITNLPSTGICSTPITLTYGSPAGGTYSGNPYISGNIFTPPSAGSYTIKYTYDLGCGPVTVTRILVITGTPSAPAAQNKEYCTNQITYLVATSGVNIRWYSGGTLVSTSNPFSTGQTTPGTYNYTVTQTVNGCEGPATAVSLTIYGGITINTQPQPSTMCAGGNTAFTVAASGLNLTYQWQENGLNITNGGIYSGATTATLTLTGAGTSKNGLPYRCVISTSCGTSPVNSNAAVLTVTALPVATFSYTGTPYCSNASNPFPTFSGGGVAGIFSSTAGLVFVSTATGQVNLAASTTGTYTVTNRIAAAGGCGEVTATSPITVTSDIIWNGAGGTDWNTPGNWSCGFVPNSTMLVQIPNVANKPVLSSGAIGAVKNILIDIGSSLTISGNTLQISGTITNNGTFTATAGIIEMNGSAAQVIGANVFAGNTIMDLIINNPAGVTLQGPLNVSGIVTPQNGTLASGGNLTLLSTAAQTALIEGSGIGSVNGNLTMQRYLPSGFGYKYFSSPFQAATVNEFSDDMSLGTTFSMFYRYDENRTSSGWVSYNTPASVLDPLHGYAANFGPGSAPNTMDMTGVVNNGPLSVTLSNHNRTYTKGFNLIGNPYPSPIDWDAAAGWIKDSVDNALYYFKASTTDQYGGTYSSYINGVPTGSDLNIIPSMQGFFVHVTDGAWPVTGILSMDNSVRINDLTHSFSKSAGSKFNSLLRLAASFSDDTASVDPFVIYSDNKATTEFDGQLDALKLMNTDLKVPNLYSVTPAGKKLSIRAMPEISGTADSVPLGLKLNRDGYVIFRIRNLEGAFSTMGISLYDKLAGITQDLVPDREYRLYLTTGEYSDRFFLNLSTIPTGVNDHNPGSDLFSVYSSHGVLKAEINILSGNEGTLKIINLTGQTVYLAKVYEQGYHEFKPGVKDGIYIVSYITGNNRFSKKIFILD